MPHINIDKDKNFDEEDEDNDIMSHLNYNKLQKIKKDFQKCEAEGLTMEQFIRVMLVHLPDTRDRVGLVKNLIELFRQIDVNNDQTLEWDEFTNHIIELGKFQIQNFKFYNFCRYGPQRQNIYRRHKELLR